MARYEGPHTALIIALHGGLYIANIMDRYEGPLTALTIVSSCKIVLRELWGPS
jgi:hypothetical protein